MRAEPATVRCRGFTLIETVVALALLGLGLLATLALVAQEPRVARRVRAHERALEALTASHEAIRAGQVGVASGAVDLEPLGFDEPPTRLAVRAEISPLSPPGLARLVLVASYPESGRRFEKRLETLVWRPP